MIVTFRRELKAAASWLPTPVVRPLRRYRDSMIKSRVEAILARNTAPQTAAAEADFDRLQREFNGVPDYGFDFHNTWKRAVGRALELAEMLPDKTHSYRVLEVGCGDAMTGYLLSTHGHQITVSDMDDWRDPMAKSLDFCKSILEQGLPYDSGAFDFIFSYNAFEHFNDPGVCFAELTRLVKPGGHIHLSFGPVYASAWGMHAASSLMMPYPQYLFSPEFTAAKLKATGIYDLGKNSDALQPMNRWTARQFCALWSGPKWRILKSDLWGPDDFLHMILRYPDSFTGRGLTFEDVITQAITVTLERQPD